MSYEQHADMDDDNTKHGRLKRRLLIILGALLVALSLAIVVWELILISSVGVHSSTGSTDHVNINIAGAPPAR